MKIPAHLALLSLVWLSVLSWRSLADEPALTTYTVPAGKAILISAHHFGKGLSITVTVNGATAQLPDYQISDAEPVFVFLPAQSRQSTITVDAKATGVGASKPGLTVSLTELNVEKAERYQSAYEKLSDILSGNSKSADIQAYYDGLKSRQLNREFSQFVSHQLLLYTTERGMWDLAIALARQIRTFNDRRLLLECEFLHRFLSSEQVGSRRTDIVAESVSRIATELSFLYRTRLALPRHSEGSMSIDNYQAACGRVYAHETVHVDLPHDRVTQEGWTTDADAWALFDVSRSKMQGLSPDSKAHVQANMWFYYNFLPDHLEAMRVGKAAIDAGEQHPEFNIDLGAMYKIVPQSMRASGKYAQAKQLIEHGLSRQDSFPPETRAMLLNNLAFTFSQIGEYDLAKRYLQLYLTALAEQGSQLTFSDNKCDQKGPFRTEIARAMVKKGSIELAMDNTKDASHYLSCAEHLLRDINDYYNVVLVIAQAELAKANNERDLAFEKATQAVTRYNPAGQTRLDALFILFEHQIQQMPEQYSTHSPCTGSDDDIRCQIARLFRFDSFYQENLLDIDNLRYPARQLTAYTLLIKLHTQLKQRKWVEVFSQKALDIIQQEQQNIENLQAWKAARYAFVETMVDLQLQKAHSEKSVNELFMLLEAHYSLEPDVENRLYTTDLTFRPPPAEPQKNRRTLSDVQHSMAENEMLVRFFSRQDTLMAMHVTRHTAALKEVGDRKSIEEYVEKTLEGIRQSRSRALVESGLFTKLFPAHVLSQYPIKKLIVIPDGQLHKLPFAMLNTSGEQNRYRPLSMDYQVLLTTSASNYFSEQGYPIIQPGKYDISVFADPMLPENVQPAVELVSRQVTGPNFFALPGTRIEAQSIRSSFPQARVNLGVQENATRGFLLSEDTRSSTLLHIATHGYFEPDAIENIGLVMSMEQSREQAGIFKLSELMSKPIQSRLVVMSGCETFLGKYYKGSGMRSMTRGFLAQGAGSTLSTLWPVQDRATADFMRRFYLHLSQLNDSSMALQATQRQMASSGRFRHPRHWSGFVLTSKRREFERLAFDTHVAAN